MAIPIKATPTLYGADAERMSRRIEDAERLFESRPQRDITQDPYYLAMREFEKKSTLHALSAPD